MTKTLMLIMLALVANHSVTASDNQYWDEVRNMISQQTELVRHKGEEWLAHFYETAPLIEAARTCALDKPLYPLIDPEWARKVGETTPGLEKAILDYRPSGKEFFEIEGEAMIAYADSLPAEERDALEQDFRRLAFLLHHAITLPHSDSSLEDLCELHQDAVSKRVHAHDQEYEVEKEKIWMKKVMETLRPTTTELKP